MGAPVVGVPGELAQGVVTDDDVRQEGADVCDQAADGFVQGRVDETYGALGGRGGVAGIGVAEQARGAGAQDGQGVGEFGGSVARSGPGGGDDAGAGAGGVVPGEHATGQQAFVVGMGEHPHQRGQRRLAHGERGSSGWADGTRRAEAVPGRRCASRPPMFSGRHTVTAPAGTVAGPRPVPDRHHPHVDAAPGTEGRPGSRFPGRAIVPHGESSAPRSAGETNTACPAVCSAIGPAPPPGHRPQEAQRGGGAPRRAPVGGHQPAVDLVQEWGLVPCVRHVSFMVEHGGATRDAAGKRRRGRCP